MFECFTHHVVEVTAFGTVTIVIFTGIIIGFYGPVEEITGLLYLLPDTRQVHQPERSAVFIDQILK